MDSKQAQLHQEIIHTRRAIDDDLARVEWRLEQTVRGVKSTAHDVMDHSLIAGIQRVQDTGNKGVALLAQYPWLTVVGGMLLGYLLGLGHADGAQRLHAKAGQVGVYTMNNSSL